MKSARSRYHGHRFPPEIIGYAVWVYHRFCLSFRDVEDLLAERGIIVSYEAIRRWCWKFGPDYARRLKKKQGRLGDTWYMDEVFVRINGRLQSHRDQHAAERFLRRLLRGQGEQPFRIVTDKLKSYDAAGRILLPGVTHDTGPYANNRAELSHQPTRMRERQMRRFKSPRQAQRFLSLHGVVHDLFCVGRHLLKSTHRRLLRARSFEVWRTETAA